MSETKEKPTEEPKQYLVDVFIPPECLDPDGAECPHFHKEEVKHYNPV